LIGVVDYGVGNLRSVEKAFEATGAAVRVSSDEGELAECEGIVLPGVGAFGAAMDRLRESGLDRFVERAAADGVPVLGLCVGLQMLFEEGLEFGRHAGLGLLPGRVLRFPDSVGVVPHMGWNAVRPTREHALFDGMMPDTYFYFVHSYYVEAGDEADVLATTEYGLRFASVCGRGAIAGAQFHPEKSQDAGLRLLANFARTVREARS
jgi:imidazole glycerol-phosphate synthase subunit HisH